MKRRLVHPSHRPLSYGRLQAFDRDGAGKSPGPWTFKPLRILDVPRHDPAFAYMFDVSYGGKKPHSTFDVGIPGAGVYRVASAAEGNAMLSGYARINARADKAIEKLVAGKQKR